VSGTVAVLDPGSFTTVQDLGRPGHARLGVSAAGAADPIALRLANLLAGNPAGAPALEMTLLGGAFRFAAPGYVALAGADMEGMIDGRPLPPWSAGPIAAGATLACRAARSGARAVLAVRGGIAVPAVLGSASTHTSSGLGGHDGRALRRGDLLAIGDAPGPPPQGARQVRPGTVARLGYDAPPGRQRILKVTRGAHADSFDLTARALLAGSVFAVSASSDRMGLRLEGPLLPPPLAGRMLTEGMPLGAIQVPPGGQPVVLFVDHQTTGGYPVIGCVITADLAAVGQLRPGDRIRFEEVSLAAALDLLRRQEEILAAPDLLGS
jgi:biotin-dependent carboxylase-like uncharacterized protein